MTNRHSVVTMEKTNEITEDVDRVPAPAAAKMLGVSLRTLDRYQAAGLVTPLPVPMRPRQFDTGQLRKLTRLPDGGAS